MFSSDVTKIRLAELKAKGAGGTIQRLRKSCDDAADVMERVGRLLLGKPLRKEHRVTLANDLRRGASALRALARFSSPRTNG